MARPVGSTAQRARAVDDAVEVQPDEEQDDDHESHPSGVQKQPGDQIEVLLGGA